MAIEVKINNVSIQYPQIGDTEWGNNATNFAIQTATAFNAIGLSNGTTVDLPGTLDVTGNTTLDANLAVAGIVNVDAGTLYVDPVNNRIGVNKTNPAQALDVVGNSAISGNETVGGTLGVTGATTLSNILSVTGDVSVNTNKFNVTASSGNTSIAGTLGVTSDITTSGILTASNSTNVTTAPPITFTGDTNTGIGHSAADTLDYVTGGVSRSRLNSTGQQSSVVPDLSGSNTTLYNEYKCRAWVNFDGTTASPSTIRASGNVSSITKNATGDYTVNFTNALPDANYAIKCQTGLTTGARRIITQYGIDASSNVVTPTTTTVRIISLDESTIAMIDASSYSVAVFR